MSDENLWGKTTYIYIVTDVIFSLTEGGIENYDHTF